MHPSVAVRFFFHVLGYQKYLKQKARSQEEEKRYERQVAEALAKLDLPIEQVIILPLSVRRQLALIGCGGK